MDSGRSNPARVAAIDCMDAQGSIVDSGMLLADTVINAMKTHSIVVIDLNGLRGASSSYFNVFLGRLQEACGLGCLERDISIEFANDVQKMTFDRSLEAIQAGQRIPILNTVPSKTTT